MLIHTWDIIFFLWRNKRLHCVCECMCVLAKGVSIRYLVGEREGGELAFSQFHSQTPFHSLIHFPAHSFTQPFTNPHSFIHFIHPSIHSSLPPFVVVVAFNDLGSHRPGCGAPIYFVLQVALGLVVFPGISYICGHVPCLSGPWQGSCRT